MEKETFSGGWERQEKEDSRGTDVCATPYPTPTPCVTVTAAVPTTKGQAGVLRAGFL